MPSSLSATGTVAVAATAERERERRQAKHAMTPTTMAPATATMEKKIGLESPRILPSADPLVASAVLVAEAASEDALLLLAEDIADADPTVFAAPVAVDVADELLPPAAEALSLSTAVWNGRQDFSGVSPSYMCSSLDSPTLVLPTLAPSVGQNVTVYFGFVPAWHAQST